MTFRQNHFNPFRSLPTLADMNRRHRELLDYQSRQEMAQPTTAAGELLVEDEANLPEESRPFREQQEDQEEEQQEPQELQHSYPDDSYCGEDSEPSLAPSPRLSAPPPPALAAPALYGIAG